MKKLLLAGAFLSAAAANAQPFSENFNAGIPSTWSMIKNDANTPYSGFNALIVSKMATQAWMAWPKTATDSCALTISYFTPAGVADRWLITPSFQVTSSNMVLFWDDYAADGTYTDSVQVMVSPTAGTTMGSFTTTLYNDKGTIGGFGKKGISLGTFNGQTIRIAFRNNNHDEYLLMLDNVGAAVLPSVDGALDSVALPRIVTASSGIVKALVSNQGATTLTSVALNYSVDGGAPVSQTFTGLNIAPYGTQWVQFSTAIATTAAGSHSIVVNLTQSNGSADPVASNNSKSNTFSIANSTTQINALIEEFTSSTCAPCASFNVTFDPLILANNANDPSSHFNIVKYQMNWPSPGNDASYNDDGLARRVYYDVNSIPDHFTNGAPGASGNQAEITNAKNAPAYLTMSGSYFIKSDSLVATVTLTPTFSLNNANFKLYMAATERNYMNPNATTTQSQYYHVMRKMLPDGNGINVSSFTNGTSQTFRQAYKYTVGNVTQMSYNFWGSPFAGNLVAFVQDPGSGQIIQSVSIPAQWPTAVNDLNGGLGNVKVYPNPAQNHAQVAFTMDKAATININVIDALGRSVYSASDNMKQGAQVVFLPVDKFAPGMYNVVISSEEGTLTQGLSVIK